MQAFVTGGTGFVGAHLVRRLLDRGASVRCLVRPGNAAANLEGLAVERIEGDLASFDLLRSAVDGCDVVFHCAADYRLYVPDPAPMYAANVEGTRHVLQASRDAGVERVVYTSTVGALGLNADGRPADETTPVRFEDMSGHYKRSKFQAERVADAFAADGLHVVIVNPSAPVGELDIKPTATGKIILDFLNGRMPAYVDTGLNLIDVRDCAEGHVLAAERGRPGERYILGNRDLTLREILHQLSTITGRSAPKVRLPYWIPWTAAAIDTGVSRLIGRVPKVPLDAVRLSRYRMFFDPSKAVRELELPQTPVEQALRRAVEWFEQRGYVSRRAAS